MKIIELVGQYFILMGKVFKRPVKRRILRQEVINEIYKLGIDSIPIVIIISVFMGAVIALQMSINLENPMLPAYLIGYATRESIMLEFSSTVTALILAGKVGSNIASEIGTMRITEQIDALEVMGVNSASHLILPKALGAMFFFPFLTLLSMFVGTIGGYLAIFTVDTITPSDYLDGTMTFFEPSRIVYGVIKMTVFAYLITTVSAFYGYYSKNNTLEVGRASTKAVVSSIINILIFNLIITKLFF